MIEFEEIPGTAIAEIHATGRIGRDEYEAIVPRIEAFFDRHEQVGLLERVHDLDGMDLSVIPRDISLALRYQDRIARCAVVGDARWLELLTKAVEPLFRCEARYFDLAELDAARAWLREAAAGA